MCWDREVDLLGIGSGDGGMTAALVAKNLGLDVLFIEKTELSFFEGQLPDLEEVFGFLIITS